MEIDKALEDLLRKEKIFYQMFDVIRLVEPECHYICEALPGGRCRRTDKNCFAIWSKTQSCSNCISKRAYEETRQLGKFEYVKDHYYFVIARPVILQTRRYVLEFVMDVSHQFAANVPEEDNFVMNLIHELENISSLDPFSGLYNKSYLHQELSLALTQRHDDPAHHNDPLYLALWDIDHFKHINDTYGHDAGDQVLLSVAHAMEKGIRKQDGFAARFGGDEFAILFHEKDRQRCEAILTAIKTAIDSQIHTLRICNETSCVHVSISYGLADVHTAADPSSAIHLADLLLYEQKYQVHQND